MDAVKDGGLSAALKSRRWAMVSLEAKEAELASLPTLSLPDLQLQTHIPDA